MGKVSTITYLSYFEKYMPQLCSFVSLSLGGPSRSVDGGTDYEFKIKQAVITPRTQALARQLNAAPEGTCGRRGRWASNASQDVTPTGGCQGMGLRIPLLEHDLG